MSPTLCGKVERGEPECYAEEAIACWQKFKEESPAEWEASEREILSAKRKGLSREKTLEARVRELEAELAQAKAAAVQWITYDGAPETLPEEFKWPMVVYESGGPPRPAEIDLDGIDGNPPFWMVADGNNHTVRVGDRWAYLPVPTEVGI